MRAAGDVGKRLVDRDALDQRREVAEHANRRVAQPLVLLEMPAGEDQPGAELFRPPSRHAAMHAERLRFVGGREHHAAAYRDRLAPQRRVQQLLDRRVEGVEIGMQDCRRGFHSESAIGFGTNEEHIADACQASQLSSRFPNFRWDARPVSGEDVQCPHFASLVG
jgi:hypothetical protein